MAYALQPYDFDGNQISTATPQQPDFLVGDLTRLMWRHKWLMLVAIVVAIALAVLYYVQCTPIYQSTAQLLVVQKRPNGFRGVDWQPSYYEEDVTTHATLIKSPAFIARTVVDWRLRELKSSAKVADLCTAIARSITISRDTKEPPGASSTIVNHSYRGFDPEDTQTVLNALIASYQRMLEETSRNVNESTLKLITQKTDDVEKALHAKVEEYQKFRKTTPLLWNGKGGARYYLDRLAEIDAKRSAINLRRTELKPRVTAIRAALKEGRDRSDIIKMIASMVSDSKRDSQSVLDERVLPLMLQEAKLLEDFGPNHPDVKSVRKQIELTRAFLAGSAGYTPPSDDPVEAYVMSLEQEMKDLDNTEQELNQLFDEEHNRARELTNIEFQDKQLSSDIARSELFHESLVKQLQGADFGKDLVGYSTSIITPAALGVQVEPRSLLIFTLAGFLGCLGGFGLALLADVSDKSFRTPDEIRRQLGLPVIGHIPFARPTAAVLRSAAAHGSRLDPSLCTYHQADSIAAEAYRGIRTSLYFSAHRQRSKVIQVTSPAVDDGKSSLASNLAITMAQSGKRTLLIDADMRRPRIHKLFGLPAEVGLSSVIVGEVDATDAIQATEIPDLWILPSGPLPPNPADLLTSPRFKELLDFVRDRYDFVLVDTPALLAVTDPSVVAPRVDGVLFALRVMRKDRNYARRALEILQAVDARPLGVVVNGIDQAGSRGYHYEHYHSPYQDCRPAAAAIPERLLDYSARS